MSQDILPLATCLKNDMSNKNSKKNKKKKPKVVYYDDGSTIADMSGVRPRRVRKDNDDGAPTRAQAIWKTYVKSVKSMIIPMLITIGIICATFLILYILLSLAI